MSLVTENHDKRKFNLSELRRLERMNISFDVLSRAAFLIKVSRNQPKIITTNNGVLKLKYQYFDVDIKETESVIHYNSGHHDEVFTDNGLIDRVRIIAS